MFFDEVQECPEIVTAIKFLVEEGSYRYILSGSLLGVEIKNLRSAPVGYLPCAAAVSSTSWSVLVSP